MPILTQNQGDTVTHLIPLPADFSPSGADGIWKCKAKITDPDEASKIEKRLGAGMAFVQDAGRWFAEIDIVAQDTSALAGSLLWSLRTWRVDTGETTTQVTGSLRIDPVAARTTAVTKPILTSEPTQFESSVLTAQAAARDASASAGVSVQAAGQATQAAEDALASKQAAKASEDAAKMWASGSAYSDRLAALIISAAEGAHLTVDWRGDSTYFGWPNSAWAPIPVAESAVRRHFETSNITFVNNGVSGWGTNTIISDWPNQMAATASDIVVIGYGANDAQGAVSPAISATEYAANLRSMATTAYALGKLVVFETPIPFTGYGDIGSQVKAQRSIQFASAMRKVAADFGAPVIDTFEFFTSLIKSADSFVLMQPDGIHLTQEGYAMRGHFQAQFFTSAARVSSPCYISPAEPMFTRYGGFNGFFPAAGSKSGAGIIAHRFSAPLLITEPGLDVYVATPYWASGSTSAIVLVNGVNVATLNLSTANGSRFFVDAETMVLRNARPGAYNISLDGAGADVGVYYLRAAPTREHYSLALSSAGTGSTVRRWECVGDIDLSTSADSTGDAHGITDICMSNSLSDSSVEVDATLASGGGFGIFGLRTNDGSTPIAGYLLYLDDSGRLTMATGSANGYVQAETLGASDLRGQQHTYRITSRTTGTVEVYVDGVSAGQYVPTTSRFRGGCLVAYSRGASKSLALKNVRVS